MRFPFEYLPPAWGPMARARDAAAEGNRERSPVVLPAVYPGARESRGYGAGAVSERFPRLDAQHATLAASAEFQEVARFSGRPDRIDLHSSAAGVEFRFRNRGQDATDGFPVRAAGLYETNASFDLVEARDPAAGGGQLVTAVGFWAAELPQG